MTARRRSSGVVAPDHDNESDAPDFMPPSDESFVSRRSLLAAQQEGAQPAASAAPANIAPATSSPDAPVAPSGRRRSGGGIPIEQDEAGEVAPPPPVENETAPAPRRRRSTAVADEEGMDHDIAAIQASQAQNNSGRGELLEAIEPLEIKVTRRLTREVFESGYYAVIGFCKKAQCNVKVVGTYDGGEIAEGSTLRVIIDDDRTVIGNFRGQTQPEYQAISTTVLPKRDNPRELARWLEQLHNIGPARATAITTAICSLGGDPFAAMASVTAMTQAGVHPEDAERIASKFNGDQLKEKGTIYLMSIADSKGKPYLNKRQIKNILESGTITNAHLRETITANPWILSEVDQIGFYTADKIARNYMNKDDDDPQRIYAGCMYALQKIGLEEGHCGLGIDALVDAASREDILDMPVSKIRPVVEDMIEKKQVVALDNVDRNGNQQTLIMRPDMDKMEKYIASRLVDMMSEGPLMERSEAEALTKEFSLRKGYQFDATQHEAVVTSLMYPVVVITGGPGTGKSTIQEVITDILTSSKMSVRGEKGALGVSLSCFTGKGAVRLSEASGFPASTTHRQLEFSPRLNAFTRNESNPLDADALINDEFSMNPTEMMYKQLLALKQGGRIVIVGDDDQLPSVDSGNCLSDLIDSRLIPVAKLDSTWRQAKNSGIPIASRRILNGEYPFKEGEKLRGIQHFNIDPDLSLHKVINIVVQRCVEMGCSPDMDISVMSPIHKSTLGDECANIVLKNAVNPVTKDDRTETIVKGQRVTEYGEPDLNAPARRGRKKKEGEEETMATFTFTLGDVVMNTKNDVKVGFMNGETGSIQGFCSVPAVNTKGEELGYYLRTVVVEVDGRLLKYDPQKLECLPYAEARTVHKEQGSQNSIAVIMIPATRASTRRLFYTGLTRASKEAIVIGTADAVYRAVCNSGPERQTGLRYRIEQKLPQIMALYEREGWDTSIFDRNAALFEKRRAHEAEVEQRVAARGSAPKWAVEDNARQNKEVRNELFGRKSKQSVRRPVRPSAPIPSLAPIGGIEPIGGVRPVAPVSAPPTPPVQQIPPASPSKVSIPPLSPISPIAPIAPVKPVAAESAQPSQVQPATQVQPAPPKDSAQPASQTPETNPRRSAYHRPTRPNRVVNLAPIEPIAPIAPIAPLKKTEGVNRSLFPQSASPSGHDSDITPLATTERMPTIQRRTIPPPLAPKKSFGYDM